MFVPSVEGQLGVGDGLSVIRNGQAEKCERLLGGVERGIIEPIGVRRFLLGKPRVARRGADHGQTGVGGNRHLGGGDAVV